MVEWSNTTSLSLVISGCAGSNPAWRKIQKYFILIITFGLLLIFDTKLFSITFFLFIYIFEIFKKYKLKT